ncbi:metallophosphoesterase [Lachnotalea glycerini]|uniref:Hydrolase n=1 Tax=Lachnotalea glycerini TaxID=1763509 RepID=A0A371JBB0_9FIRM|nr:metallophosphoesterase [Lachnotalea glycerini]RDY30040.1 hydrolase [Lachnotalea glycerini]
MLYFTSDTHFYCKKPPFIGKHLFQSCEEKNEYIIRQWNSVVKPEDEVYLLGDVSDGTGEQTNEILKRLNGTKYLVIGNNDKYLKDSQFDQSLYVWTKQYYELRTLNTKFALFHFPIEVWVGYDNDRAHLHGHLHSLKATREPIRRYEVGVDSHYGKPVSIEEIWESIKDFHNKNDKLNYI